MRRPFRFTTEAVARRSEERQESADANLTGALRAAAYPDLMQNAVPISAAEPSRARRLRARTHPIHERLDRAMMARAPFASRGRYGDFLRMQHAFHRDLDALYRDPHVAALLPDLAERRKLPLVEADLADLRTEPGDGLPAAVPGEGIGAALGWLYVCEGSSLGAAFLLKDAETLGFSAGFGARHLGAPEEGRGLRWRRFTQALDAIELTPDEEAEAEDGAVAAFAHANALMEAALGPAERSPG